jgi:hypothetical protein
LLLSLALAGHDRVLAGRSHVTDARKGKIPCFALAHVLQLAALRFEGDILKYTHPGPCRRVISQHIMPDFSFWFNPMALSLIGYKDNRRYRTTGSR